MNKIFCEDCNVEMTLCGVKGKYGKIYGFKCPVCGKEMPIEYKPMTYKQSTQLELTPSWLMLKKKEEILSKLADILTANLIWDSNNGLPDKHKKEIKKLLAIYYNMFGDEHKNGVNYE